MAITATRFHDFCAGHRVLGHENKCRHLHGHNYRVHFTIQAIDGLDSIGRVLDFSVIKTLLCDWLELNWDHKTLLYREDPLVKELQKITPDDIVTVPFNPTAENMARFLVEQVGPATLDGLGVELVKCVVEETRKCSASYEITSK
jgi:6-pyruvoyltetrahydropterin/6-carboxytetrahydropterin synthase